MKFVNKKNNFVENPNRKIIFDLFQKKNRKIKIN